MLGENQVPGITAIISKNIIGNEVEKLNIMLKAMLYESFYSHGIYTDNKNGIFVGYSSIKDSYSDCMPIYNEKKDLILFFSGECYYDMELVNDLYKKGHTFEPNNASLLIHLYEEIKDSFFKKINGCFSGIILDLKDKSIILFNDRFARKMIYYYESKEAFLFSSEAKSILKAYPELRKIDTESIGEYLTYDSVLENRTYFKNIFLLPPSSLWKIKNNNLQKNNYFHFNEFENQEVLNKEDFFEEFSSVFKRVIPRYLKGRSLGMSLTGGLDTRSIISCIKPEPKTLPCYTYNSNYREILDVKFASMITKSLCQEHHVLNLGNDFFSKYSTYIEKAIYITDGLINITKIDELYFNILARNVASIKISGSWGSELLKKAWLNFYEILPDVKLINDDFKSHIERAKERRKELIDKDSYTFLFSKEMPWWCNAMIRIESSQLDVRTPYLDNELIELIYKNPSRDQEHGIEIQRRLVRENIQELSSIPTTSGYVEGCSSLEKYFKKWYITTFSKFDHYLMTEKLPHYMSDYIYKINNLLTDLNIEKLFFGLVYFRRFNQWIRVQLSGYLKELLLNERTYNRAYWNKDYIEHVVINHIKGNRNYTREIRKIVQLEMIHRVLIEDIDSK
jgi:asparagine synthase (glutamine-hydrolysing)